MIKWSDDYKTGNLMIDTQHKKLFDIAMMTEALLGDEYMYDKYDQIMNSLRELKNYTEYHFQCEEKLMAISNYPHLAEHKLLHIECIEEINYMLSQDIDADQSEVLLAIANFVIDWITNHIYEIDKNMSKQLKG